MFAGRAGVVLRAQTVTDVLHGTPATTTLEVVVAYLEQISRGVSDDLPLYGLDYALSVTFHFRTSSSTLFDTPLVDDSVLLELYRTELLLKALY